MLRFVRLHLMHPLRKFMEDSRAVGITLLTLTALSLFLANTGFWQEGYRNLWSSTFDDTAHHHINIGLLSLPNSITGIINDALMVFFFFLAGMEIRREMVSGELASIKKSSLPVLAAIGGMIVPAILFAMCNKGTGYIEGWAIPAATDIAFALGIASLLGKRVPVGLRIFLIALAIIDDLGAIVIIAVFYGGSLQWIYLLVCLLMTGLLAFLHHKKIPFGWKYWLAGLVLWYAMFNSGIHATVAGVVFAFLVPMHTVPRLEEKWYRPVYFIIMPLFALANTAIAFPENGLQSFNNTLSWGIITGLCIGKPAGICAACYLLVKKKMAALPTGTSWYQLIGGSLLAGIGFTMSIFIATLAFADPQEQDMAKMAVLLASFIAMIGGFIWLRAGHKKRTPLLH